jgi:hypothetical protein
MVLEREDPLASLIPALFVMKLVTVRFCFRFTDSDLIIVITSPARILKVNSAEKKLKRSDSRDSRGIYDVHLGLHSYVQDGGRSRLVIKMEFYEGAVPLSALLAFY